MPKTNAKLTAILQEMADINEILGANRFKNIALQKAARITGDHPTPLASLDETELKTLDGIGKGVASRITEWVKTGKVQELEELRAKVPPGLPAILNVPGLGPKTVQLLWKEAGIDSVDTLKTALNDNQSAAKITSIKGLGPKKLEAIRKNLDFLERSAGRIRLGTAMTLAEHLLQHVRSFEGVEEAVHAGSLRRGKETIGDIDILVRTHADEPTRRKIARHFAELDLVREVLAEGATKASVRVGLEGSDTEVQVDLRMVAADSFGAALMYFTGSKEHNVAMRERAQAQGMSLNEYGLWKGPRKGAPKASDTNDELVVGATEHDVYKALGLAWVAPEMREDRGELARADADNLPTLIETDDILADLHTHTTASDGSLSIEDMALAAIDRGLKVLAITDHSKSQVQANGLSADRLLEHVAEIRKVAKKLKNKITLLAGSEVDILSDGTLDYPDDILQQLDVVVASPHAALSQSPKQATERLLKAIEHPRVHIIGHPTGRLINRREGLSPDITKLIEAAKAHRVALEINANHYRLDLRDTHAALAVEAGVPLAINTDAHADTDFHQLRYGVLTARRAAATPNDVINAWPTQKLLDWLNK